MSADPTATLAAWKATAAAATEGPWVAKDISDDDYSPDDKTGWWWVWQESKLPHYGGILESHDEFGEGAIGPASIDDNRTGAQERRDAEFIAQSRTIVPALLSAVKGVLDLHKPDKCGDCTECSPVDYGIAWPCPTVKIIQHALESE